MIFFSFFYRINFRFISSVIPETDLRVANDFSIKNEPILGYLPGSKVFCFSVLLEILKFRNFWVIIQERLDLESALKKYGNGAVEDVPIIIGGKEYRTEEVKYQVMVNNLTFFVQIQ